MLLRKLKPYARAVLLSGEMTLRQTAVDAFVLFSVVIQPLIIAVLGLWMLRARGGDYAIFVVIGSGMTGLWSSLLFISGNSITFERWTGTLELLVGMPTPMSVIVLGKNLANVFLSLTSIAVSYFFAGLLLGFPLQIAQPGLFVVSLALTVVSFVSFGLVLSPLFIVNPEVQRWQNGLEFPIYILCGFLFPIALLPGWTTPLSYLLAPYWAAQALHATASGAGELQSLWFDWVMMLAFSLLYIVLAAWMFRRLIDRARNDATLGFE